jgi:hypothetical protein
VAEQAGVVLIVPGGEMVEFAAGLVGEEFGGPNLAVGMGIAGAHHGSAILKDLDVADPGDGGELAELLLPGGDDGADRGDRHAGECEGVVGVEAEDATEAAFGLGAEERIGGDPGGRVGKERGEIVIEDEGAGVGGIAGGVSARVAGAEVAVGVVVGGGRLWRGDFALPGAVGAVGRDDDPFAAEGIEAAVGMGEVGGGHE